MRLDTPFVRLPIRVDPAVLAAEVDALPPELWRAHPEGAPGNTAVPLIARNGDPGDDRAKGVMAPTPHLDRLPYVRRVLGALGSVLGRTRLMRIEEEGELTSHIDTNYYWRDHLRVHVPVLTTPDVEFACADEQVHMGAGEVWVFDTWRPHHVVNPSRTPRVHLVVDTVGGPALWRRIDDPDVPVVEVGIDGADPVLVTERVNQPLVMTPWELEHALDLLMAELEESAPSVVVELEGPVVELVRAWHEVWARFGDDADGWDHFHELRQRGDAALARLAGDARLPNGVLAMEAIRQHALRPALDADRGEPPAPLSLPPSPTSPRRPQLDRPVFVVSSPRSGSTLLFETLALAPELFTIGGESHQVIERIPGLSPADHEWRSNRLTASDATPDAVAALRHAFATQLRDASGNPPAGGSVRMLEKTPKNSLRVPMLSAAFPDARFVYLYRDPRETISSMLDAWKSGRFVTYRELPGWNGPPWSLLLVPGWRELAAAPLGEIVTRQWATATTMLLDDLEALDPDRWCVSSYDRLLADPQAEIDRLCAFCDVDTVSELPEALPLSRHTLDSPAPEKWRRNAAELDPHWEPIADVALRAHEVFAEPPRIKPARSHAPTDREATPAPAVPPVPPVAPSGDGDPRSFQSVFTGSFPNLLDGLGASLCVSTYQSGRVILLRAEDERTLNTHFCVFTTPMGVAVRPGELALGTKSQVLRFQDQPALSNRLDPPGRHDAVYVPRRTHQTGDIRIHDLGFVGDELWAVNTRFSCLVSFDDDTSFVPRWRPPFVSALAAEDRCHLNGMAIIDDEVRYVTALGTSDESSGWRERKVDGGVLLHVPSGEVVLSGLCMPHSPRWHDGRLWMLESGLGAVCVVDPETGTREEVTRVPGFTRGMSFAGHYAFVGLSQVRESLFEGIPLKADGVERSCGIWAIDLRTGETAAFLRFEGIVQELYEVAVLEQQRWPEIVEPGAEVLDTAFVLSDEAMADVAQSPAPHGEET